MADDFDTFWIKRNPLTRTHTDTHTHTHIHTHPAMLSTHGIFFAQCMIHSSYPPWFLQKGLWKWTLRDTPVAKLESISTIKVSVYLLQMSTALRQAESTRIWYSRFYFGVSVAHLWHLDFLLDGSQWVLIQFSPVKQMLMLRYNQKQPPEVFYKKSVLKKISKFTGKYLCQSLFSIKSVRPATLLKKKSRHRCFSMNFVKF